MPDRTIDDLLEAIETVQILRDTLAKHETMIARIADRLDVFDKRLSAVEARAVHPSG